MNEAAASAGPLQGIKVLDFGHYYAGPMLGMLLADQGADVVRISKPGEAELPPERHALYNRNKAELEIDLKSEEGLAHVMRLVESADVLIENFRPGVMTRLGLGPDKLREINRRLIYISLPGFASTDKDRAGIQAWEGVICAAVGIYAEASIFGSILGHPPVYTAMPMCSSYGAMHGAVAVASALNAREVSGEGALIEVPLMDAGVSSLSDCFISRPVHTQTLRAVSEDEPQTPASMLEFQYEEGDSTEDRERKVFGAMDTLFGAGAFGLYQTRDDKWVVVVPFMRKSVERCFKVLGIYDRLIDEGYIVHPDGPWADSNYLGTNLFGGLSPENAAYIKSLVAPIIRKKCATDWEQIMGEARVPFSIIRTRDEFFGVEAFKKSAVIAKMELDGRQMWMPGRCVDVGASDGSAPEVRLNPPANAQVSDILEAWAPPESEQWGAFKETGKGQMLAGLKVLDLCNILAGPTSGYTLAQYGAEVIMAEPSQSFNGPIQLIDNLQARQGKKSLIWDIGTAPGREIFSRLVKWADVIVHNCIDGTAERLGVSWEQVRKLNPDVVVSQFSALGGSVRGGWERRPGIDPQGNMPTGQYFQLGSKDYPACYGGVSADLIGGISLAFSALLGLFQRHRTGVGCETRASLLRGSCLNQLPFMIADESGPINWNEPTGLGALGESPDYRMYQCSDGWIFVASLGGESVGWAKELLQRQDVQEQDIEELFCEKTVSQCSTLLSGVDVAHHKVCSMDDLCDGKGDSLRRVDNSSLEESATGALEMLRWDDHPCGKPVILPAPSWVRIGKKQTYWRSAPAARWGSGTRSVLELLGFSEEEIKEMVRLGCAFDYLPAIGADKYFFEPARAPHGYAKVFSSEKDECA